MPPVGSQAEETRGRLVEAATREFAQHGIHAASLLEITRQAGQRNRGAVHYHFGSREGMLAAVLEQHVDVLAARETELLTRARARAGDLAAAVEAFVRPSVELAERGWTGRAYLVILAELVEDDPESVPPEVVAVLERMGGYEAVGMLEERMPAMPEALRSERISLALAFLLRAIADRARAGDRPASSRPQLPTEPFLQNLVTMVAAMLTAPVPGSAPDDGGG